MGVNLKDFSAKLGPLPQSDENARLQRESFKALGRLLSGQDSLVFRDERIEDYGVDGSLEVNFGGLMTNFRAQTQMKAATSLAGTAAGYIARSVATANLNHLLNGVCPLYILWDASTDEFWYVWVQDENRRLSAENSSWRDQDSVTLQFRERLTAEVLPAIQLKILESGLFLRGLHDLLAQSGTGATVTIQPSATIQRGFQLLDKTTRVTAAFAMPLRLPIPANHEDFEKLSRDLLRLHWSRPGLELFGKRGERQYGIDILDLGGQEPLYAAQSKLKEPHKSLPPQSIQDEVNEARRFTPPLGKYGILTTGKVSVEAQRKVREINVLHTSRGLFEVELFAWEKISELIQLYPELYEQYYGGITVSRGARIESAVVQVQQSVVALTSRIEGDEIDTLINEARDAVNQHDYQMATLLLNRIEQQKGHLLTAFQRFRVISNHGFAALGQGNPTLAAKCFLEALPLAPEDERARTNEVLAYYATGDFATAYEKASRLRHIYPASTSLASYWIATSPLEVPTSDLEKELSSILLSDGQVRTALASKALSRHELDAAESHAQMGISWDRPQGHPQLVLAKVHMARVVDLEAGRSSSPRPKAELLERAEQCIGEAIRLAEAANDLQTQTQAHILFVEILLMQNKGALAADEADRAIQLSPDDAPSLMARAQAQFAKNQIDDGIASLERAYAVDPRADVAFNYGNALFNRSKNKDLEIAAEVLTGIEMATVVPMMRHAVAVQTVRALAKKQDWDAGRLYLDEVAPLVDPESAAALRGLLAHSEGLTQEAEAQAVKSQQLLTAASSMELKVFLARLFMLIGRPADALPLFQEAFDADLPSFDYGNLLDCAARLARDGVIIEAFRTLRARGLDDWNTVSFGVQYLQKYDPIEAIEVLDAFLKNNPSHKLAKLSRSVIGLLINRAELVSGSLSDLPTVEELPVENVVQVVHILRFAKNPDAAVDYAYRFLRLHFKQPQAHRALLISMTPFEPSPTFSPTLDAVEIGAAVRFEELPGGVPEWRVVEDTTDPSSDFEEVAVGSKLASDLMGKRVGDTFLIAPGTIERRGRILQIVPKYVRRYNDSGDRWQINFPDEPMIEAVHLGNTEEQVRENLELVLQTFQKRAEIEVEMKRTYSALATPLHLYGSWHGKNAYVALIALASEPGQRIRTSFGTMNERSDALAALETAGSLVIDLSTLATLRLLGLEQILATSRFRFLITVSSLRELRETLHRPETETSPSISIQFVDGKQVAHEESVEFKRKRVQADHEFLELVEKHCEAVPVIELASLESTKRETLEKAFGQYGVEAMILASKPDYMLWTDDLVQSQIAITEFGARRVWTQTVIAFLAELGIVAAKERDAATAKLIGMGYDVTYFDASAILEAVALTNATPWQTPLKNFVDEFGGAKADLSGLFPILIELIVRLYREGIVPESRCSVTTAFLDAVWKNAAARRSLLNLRAETKRLFGLNLVGQAQFEHCFDRWYKLIESPLIPGA
jgi:tetratricopeptide (TPR) repeat protein